MEEDGGEEGNCLQLRVFFSSVLGVIFISIVFTCCLSSSRILIYTYIVAGRNLARVLVKTNKRENRRVRFNEVKRFV